MISEPTKSNILRKRPTSTIRTRLRERIRERIRERHKLNLKKKKN
jgi:hypothetical protein